MILRWTDPAYGQHYIDGVRHATLLGVWGWNDDPRVERMVRASSDGTPVSETPSRGSSEQPCIPDYASAYECAEVWHVTPAPLWRPDQTPAVLYMLVNSYDGAPAVHSIVCVWAALLNDQGDTIDRLYTTRSVAAG